MVPKEISYGKYLFVKALGEGGQGVVSLYEQQKPHKEYVAVKFDQIPKENQKLQTNILKECMFHKEYSGKILRIPAYISHSNLPRDEQFSNGGQRRYLIMQYFDKSVEDYIDECEKRGQPRLQVIKFLAL